MGSSQSHTSADAQVRSPQSPRFGEWQDIASAPRDGTWFLAYRGPSSSGKWDTLLRVCWNDEAEDFVWPDGVFDAWNPPNLDERDEDDWLIHELYESRGTLTHWTPLPEPPSLGDGSSRTATKANSGLNTINEVSQ